MSMFNRARRNPECRRRTTPGFTLVELLAVIAIIAILAAILFPALGSATERGKETRCMNNLKSWGQGLMLHLASSDGVFPEEGIEGGYVSPTNLAAWYNAIPNALGAESMEFLVVRANPRRPPRPPNDKSIFTCPSYKAADVPAGLAAFQPVYSYAYNLWIHHPVPSRESQNSPPFNGAGKSGLGTLLRLSQLTKPAKFVVWGEASGSSFDNMTSYHLVYRHRGTNAVNMVFADGHAETMSRTNVYVANQASNKGRNQGVIWNPEGTPNQYDAAW